MAFSGCAAGDFSDYIPFAINRRGQEPFKACFLTGSFLEEVKSHVAVLVEL